MDDFDIWTSPDPSTTTEKDTQPSSQTAPVNSTSTAAAASSSSRPVSVSKNLFEDDLTLDAHWGTQEEEKESEAPLQTVADGLDKLDIGQAADAKPPASPPQEEEEDDEDAFHEAQDDSHQPAAADPQPSTTNGHESPVKGGDDDDDFGDFDDDDQRGVQANAAPDDDFGDFGDFPEDGQAQSDADDDFGGFDDEEENIASQPQPIPPVEAQEAQERQWPLLSLSDPSHASLQSQINSILSPPTVANGPSEPFGSGWSSHLSQDHIRQVEGPSQVLIGESSRQVYSTLSSPPPLKPTDWLRSHTRRDLYISLGVPINLDELEPASSSSSSRLPTLNISLDDSQRVSAGPSSAAATDTMDSTRDSAVNGIGGVGDKKRERQRAMEKRMENLGLERPPVVDMKRLEEVCALSEDQLSLLPLPSLQSLRRELETFTTQTSTLLTHHLTLRESLQSDSETYNGLIADLVAGAASRIGGGGQSGKKAERSNSVRVSSKRSTFAGATPTSASTGNRFGTPPGGTAVSSPRSGSPAPGSAGWRR